MLRKYQQEALDKLMWDRSLPGNSLISLPTGSGKSHIIAEYAKAINEPVLIFQPSRELVIQNVDKMLKIVDKSEIGIYSASLGKKVVKKYTFGTIGSVVNHPELFSHFKNIIIDEAHKVPIKKFNSMYMKFFSTIKNVKVVGLTATPYRLTPQYMRYKSGFIETITTIKLINRMRPMFWNRLIYNINVGDLINQGYLCKLKYRYIPLIQQEDIKLNKSRSDFDLLAFEEQISYGDKAIYKVLFGCKMHFKSSLVFCSSVDQAEQLADRITGAEVVSAKTKPKERKRIVEGFKDGSIEMVFNVGIFVCGFDHPALDCIVLLRPTRSLGLLYQMIGRGLRTAPGKEYCTVVDMTDTIKKVGRIETFKIEKVDGKWNLTTEKGQWHNKELYRFAIQK